MAAAPAHRVATEADLDRIAEVLALAFENDSAWSWAFEGEGGPVDRERKLEALGVIFRFCAAAALGYGWVRVTAGLEAIALWIPPGEPEMSPADAERFPAVIRAACGEATAARMLMLMDGFEAGRPTEPPHYFLDMIGTHPDHTGHGHGLGLMAANLEEIDVAGRSPVFLETLKPHNVGLYERFGFEVEHRVELVPGLTSFQMWRR